MFDNIQIFFIFNKKRYLKAGTLLNYLRRHLQAKKLRGRRVIKRMINYLNKKIKIRAIVGYKFSVTGRMSRRDRISYIWASRGLNTISKKILRIDYSDQLFFTKYSIGIIKL